MGTRHSIIGLVEILNWMVAKGYSKTALLQETNIDEERLRNPKATLMPQEELQFYRNLLSVSGDPSILLEAGFNLKLATYGIWGLALISSPTFGKAIELGTQFIDFTYTYNHIFLVEGSDCASLRIARAEDLGVLQQPMIERDISAAYVLFQVLLQQEHPVDEIHLTWPENGLANHYQTLFGCKISFDQPFNELRFPQSKLSHELPQHNSLAMQLCKEQLEQIRPQLNVEDSTLDQVHRYLSSTPLYRADMEECAQQLNISSRTLRRKLEAEGSSYQSILDGFRYALAQKYLTNTNMTLEEIAERLGYSDAANFSHAFKRWSGVAPRRSSH